MSKKNYPIKLVLIKSKILSRNYKRSCERAPNMILLTLELHPGQLDMPFSIILTYLGRCWSYLSMHIGYA